MKFFKKEKKCKVTREQACNEVTKIKDKLDLLIEKWEKKPTREIAASE